MHGHIAPKTSDFKCIPCHLKRKVSTRGSQGAEEQPLQTAISEAWIVQSIGV